MSAVMVMRRVTAADEVAWERLVATSADSTFFSSRLWLDALAVAGVLVTRYLVEGDGGVIAGLAVSSTGRRATPLPATPYSGLLLSGTGTTKRSKQESIVGRVVQAVSAGLEAEHDEIILSLSPTLVDVRPFQWEGYTVRPRYSYVIPALPADDLWQRMDDKLRNVIRRAEKLGVRVQAGADLAAVWDLYAGTHERKGLGLPVQRETLAQLLADLTATRRGELFLATAADGTPAACALVVWDEQRAYYLLGGSDPMQNQLAAPSLLQWKIVQELSARNLPYDMLGANTPAVAAFKAGFNPQLVLYHEITKVMPGALAFRRALRQVARAGSAALRGFLRRKA